MSDLEEFDVHEYAKQLGYVDELTRADFTDPTVERAKTPSDGRGMTRRDLLLKGTVGAAAVAGLGALAGPAVAGTSRKGAFTGTMNVISLGVEWPPGAQKQAEKDLGFKFNVQVMGTNAQVQKAITAPESFDVGGLYNYQFFQIWPTGNAIPVDTRKLKDWNSFYPLFTKGRVLPASKSCTTGQGNAPYRAIFLDTDGSTGLPLTPSGPRSNKQIVIWWDDAKNRAFGGKPEPRWVVGPPAHFNMDSMGYNGDVITKPPQNVHWAELLNTKWKGRVALLNDPAILTQDAGNAVQSAGLMKFKDVGNMTRAEMDRLFKILTKYKKNGQFRGFWVTFNESVNLMASKEVVIESMWSPAVAQLVAQGVNCRYAFPSEGMRGWCSAQGIMKHVGSDADKLEAAYNYLNWMTDGFLGALIMRQGYYISNGATLRKWIEGPGADFGFTPPEYDFWYGGKPAPTDLPGITGNVGDIKKGQVRDGGSFVKRSCHYASWNSFFHQNLYQIKKVNEFLSA